MEFPMYKRRSGSIQVGNIYHTNKYGDIRIIEYYNANNIIVEFCESHNRISVYYAAIKNGNIKDREPVNPAYKIYGVGVIGYGLYTSKTCPAIYRKWRLMLERCYDTNGRAKNPAYNDCAVCAEWHNFQNFAKWFLAEKIPLDYELDKDIVNKNSRLYSPQTCLLIPKEINRTFHYQRSARGSNPIGVHEVSKDKYPLPYVAAVGINGHCTYIGNYLTKEQAFEAYRNKKRQVINEMAEKYKDVISDRAYRSLLNYRIDIND